MGPWLSSFDEPQDVIESIGRARAAGHRQKGNRQCCVFLSCPHCFLTRCTEMDGKPRPFKQCLTRDLCLFFFLSAFRHTICIPTTARRTGRDSVRQGVFWSFFPALLMYLFSFSVRGLQVHCKSVLLLVELIGIGFNNLRCFRSVP